jgi:hypothetical protein
MKLVHLGAFAYIDDPFLDATLGLPSLNPIKLVNKKYTARIQIYYVQQRNLYHLDFGMLQLVERW